MTGTEMTLIERLQAATEGSRELDARLWCLVEDHEFHGMYGCTDKPEKNGSFVKFSYKSGQPHKGNTTQLFSLFPHYTTNLQDAVSLIPEGYDWDVGYLADNGQVHAHVMFMAPAGQFAEAFECKPEDKIHWSDTGRSQSPALALCQAIIKAQESKAEAPKLTDAQKRVVDDLV